MSMATYQRSEIAIALHDYNASCYDELSVKKKEKLTILDDSNGWWKVKNNDNQIGRVPSNYLKRIDECKSKTIGRFKNLFSKKCKNNPPSVQENDHPFYESVNDDPDGNTGKTPCMLTLTEKTEKDDALVSNKVDGDVICKVKTLYPFIAQDGDELPFEAGEILDIIDQPEDNPGWSKARNGNGNVGLIPFNRVKILKPASCNQTSNSQTADNHKEYDYANVASVTYPGDNQGKMNERHLDEISKFLVRDWKHLGRTLRVKEATIETIDEDNHDVREKTYQLLLTWMRANGRDASAEVLANALVSIERRDVAEILASIMAEPGYAEPSKSSYVLFGTPKPDAQNHESYATPYEAANIGRKHVENAGYASPYEEPNIAAATSCVGNTGYVRPYEEPNIAAATSCVRNTVLVPRQTVGPQTQLTGKRQNPRTANAVKSGEKAGGASAQISSECLKHKIKMSEVGWAKTQPLCCLLNTELKGDFGKLAKELGYSEGEIQEFEESINPTRSILTKHNDLFAVEVLRALEQIQINDAVDVLRKELGTIAKKRECKCESCS